MSLGERLSKIREGKDTAPIIDSKGEGAKAGLYGLVMDLVHPQIDSDLLRSEDVEARDTYIRDKVEDALLKVCSEQGLSLSQSEHHVMVTRIVSGILGLGPLEGLLRDESVSEIMVNGPEKVYVERKGKLLISDVKFKNDDEVLDIIDKILKPIGRRCDDQQPYVDARLHDGSRVNVVIPPLSLDGPMITIRKFSKSPLQVKDLIGFGTLTGEMAELLRACVEARLNIIISGGTGSGKTTLLNVLSNFIPDDERILTVEDAAELQLHKDHVGRLETRPPNFEGKGEVTIRDLVRNSLRMRPDRIVVGECRGAEALDMLQAMNTGHDGSLTTLHANSPRDAIARLETLVMMAGYELPLKAVRAQVASAVDLIVQQSRLNDGSRKITYITEVQGMEQEMVVLQDVFVFEQEGIDPETGRVVGRLKPTGIVPHFFEKFKSQGIEVPQSIFFTQG